MDLSRRLKPTHLRLILKIAECEKLQIAATTMAMSQPAASRMLAEIEGIIGDALFIRYPRGMVPTLVGKAFVKRAHAILTEFDGLSDEVSNISGGIVGEVSIGSVTGPAVSALVPAVQAVKNAAPGIEVTIEVAPSTDLIRGLHEGRFDFVLARLPHDHDSRDFRVLPARNEVVSLIVRGGHPLLAAAPITFEQLSGYSWIIQERGSPIRQAVEHAFHMAGAPVPADVTNSSSLLVMLAFLEQSDSITTVTDEVASLLSRNAIGANLGILTPPSPITVPPYFLIYHRTQPLSRVAERVLDEVLTRI